jgi:hypothetical protein
VLSSTQNLKLCQNAAISKLKNVLCPAPAQFPGMWFWNRATILPLENDWGGYTVNVQSLGMRFSLWYCICSSCSSKPSIKAWRRQESLSGLMWCLANKLVPRVCTPVAVKCCTFALSDLLWLIPSEYSSLVKHNTRHLDVLVTWMWSRGRLPCAKIKSSLKK